MLSQKIQGAVGRELTVRPLRKDALLAPYMTPMKDIALFPNYEEGWGGLSTKLRSSRGGTSISKTSNRNAEVKAIAERAELF